MQQLMLGYGAKKKTYLDDVFSTYLYTGNATARSINNGVDLAGEGGMVWIKMRDNNLGEGIFDTERGTNKTIFSSQTAANYTTTTDITSFNSNGFSLGTSSTWFTNRNTNTYASWSFRKAPGFFDVVTWTGNDSNRTIAHNLGCVPGCIMVKRTDAVNEWAVYHRDVGTGKYLKLESNAAAVTSSQAWNGVPTATHIGIGPFSYVNANNGEYVAYLFAGGESTAATARSVDISGGAGNYLNVQSTSSDLEMGSSDFTFECWLKPDGLTTYNQTFFSLGNPVQFQHNVTGNKLCIMLQDTGNNWFINCPSSPPLTDGAWNHFAFTRSGNTWRMFLNGTQFYTGTHNVTVGGLDGTYPSIGSLNSGSNAYGYHGKISNLRFVKGTAVYTSSFRPPTEPLTNITNTKLLCCNNSSVTGYTVSPAALAASGSGNPAASTDSPFDDPAAFTFGDSEGGIIKCGSYVGNGSATGPEIFLGFEPQWVLTKNADDADEWYIFDSMRGIVSGGDDPRLRPNSNSAEASGDQRLEVTPTGFKITSDNGDVNGNGNTIIYMCIRRPDGYVGKPADAGTDVFNTASYDSTAPAFNANFPVDMGFFKRSQQSNSWRLSARLIAETYLEIDNTGAGSAETDYVFDYNDGWNKQTGYANTELSWMFKRHSGFDVVTYKGDGVAGRKIPHSLNKTPEMIWIRARNGGEWIVGHHGVNSGTNPWNYEMLLHDARAEGASANKFNNTAPTSIVFTVGDNTYVNQSGTNYVSMLFSSVAGISKVGSYTGNGVKTGNVQTLGFQPRFIFIKCTDTASTIWLVFDTLLGINSGDDNFLRLNGTNSTSAGDFIDLTSDGFDVVEDLNNVNGNNKKYIYYAHA